jgi:hypothetical protein
VDMIRQAYQGGKVTTNQQPTNTTAKPPSERKHDSQASVQHKTTICTSGRQTSVTTNIQHPNSSNQHGRAAKHPSRPRPPWQQCEESSADRNKEGNYANHTGSCREGQSNDVSKENMTPHSVDITSPQASKGFHLYPQPQARLTPPVKTPQDLGDEVFGHWPLLGCISFPVLGNSVKALHPRNVRLAEIRETPVG